MTREDQIKILADKMRDIGFHVNAVNIAVFALQALNLNPRKP